MTEFDAKMIFGDILYHLIQDAHMTQQEVSEYSGISQSTISRYIGGDTYPSFKAIINLADTLCCDFNTLLGYGILTHIE